MNITSITDVSSSVAPMPEGGSPYVLESREFERFVHAKRTAAARAVADLDREIERLNAEVDARLVRRNDLMSIVQRADAMLAVTFNDVVVQPAAEQPAAEQSAIQRSDIEMVA